MSPRFWVPFRDSKRYKKFSQNEDGSWRCDGSCWVRSELDMGVNDSNSLPPSATPTPPSSEGGLRLNNGRPYDAYENFRRDHAKTVLLSSSSLSPFLSRPFGAPSPRGRVWDPQHVPALRAIDDRPYRDTKDIRTTHRPISQMSSGGGGQDGALRGEGGDSAHHRVIPCA